MAVRTRRFENTVVDANGNLHANGVGMSTGPGKTADEVREDRMNNVVNSIVPSPTGENTSLPSAAGTPEITMTTVPGNRNSMSYKTMLESWENEGKPSYSMSERVRNYQNRLDDIEDAEKPTWQSKYEPAIQSILDGILNRKPFDIKNDTNYQTLYDQYAQQYMAQGNRAMRDQLGAAAALTGGYGSTAAQAAASQAYDNYMQNLNDRNVQLMNLAYGMYQDEAADRYNQLNATTNLDNIDYGRYRDDVSDFFNERDYWANRYQQEYANDYGQYRDDVSDYYTDRDYLANRYTTEYGFETDEDNTKYSRYQDAVEMAMQYASKGLPIPSYIAKQITDYTGAADISDVIAAMPVTTGGSGGSGGGRGRSGRSSGSKKSSTVYNSGGWMPYADELSKSQRYENEVIAKAQKMGSDADKYDYIAGLADDNKLTWVQAEAILKRLGITQNPYRAAQATIDEINARPVTFLKKAPLKW